MKATRALFASVCAAGLFALATPAMAQTTIKYSSWLPNNHWLNQKGMMPWMEAVDKATQGKVKVEILPKTVGTPPSQADVVTDGLADLSLIVAGYTPGRFETVEMGEFPFIGEHQPSMSPAFDRIYRKHLAKANEFKGLEVLCIFTISPGHIFTTKKQVKTFDDLKGLKIRSPSGTATKAMTALGMVPILKSSTEAYELLTGGIIDGSLMFYETVKSTNSLEVMKFGAIVPGGIYNAVLSIVMNEAKWKSLSAADQRAIMGVSAEVQAAHFGKAYEEADDDGLIAIKNAKISLETVSPTVLAEMKKAVAPMEDDWIARAKKKGIVDPAAVLAEFRAEVAKAAPKK